MYINDFFDGVILRHCVCICTSYMITKLFDTAITERLSPSRIWRLEAPSSFHLHCRCNRSGETVASRLVLLFCSNCGMRCGHCHRWPRVAQCVQPDAVAVQQLLQLGAAVLATVPAAHRIPRVSVMVSIA
jgi:hypothetical protein